MTFPPRDLDPGLPDALSRDAECCAYQRLESWTGCDSPAQKRWVARPNDADFSISGVTPGATDLVSDPARP